MTAKVLVLGLDSMDASLIERWCDEGYLPHLDRIRAESAAFRLANTLDCLPGAIWVELSTGRSAGRDGRFYAPDQIRTGEAELRRIAADEVETAHDVWNVAGAAGRRVLAFDVPERRPRPGVNGIHVSDWGGHDMQWPCAAQPVELVDELRARFAPHPVPDCNVVHRTGPERYSQLVRDLTAGVELRADVLRSLLERESWDLAFVGFVEVHCVGHQFWLFTDVGAPHRHPVTVEDPPADLHTAMRDVYVATDAAIGRLLEQQGSDTYVCTLASHGYGPFTEGPQLLPEVLARLGLRRKHELPVADLPSKLPAPVRARLRRMLPRSLRWKRAVLAGRTPHRELVLRSTRAVSLPNNRCGAIRLNLRGREPFGSVDPGEEAGALIGEIRRALHELREPVSGEPIVVRTMTPVERFGPGHHPDLPDLMVLFRDDLGPIEACTSPRIGLVEVPLFPRDRRADGWPVNLRRTGDHAPESRLWIRGPGITTGTVTADGRAIDVAPTILGLLGVPVPDDVDGVSLLTGGQDSDAS